MPPKKNVDVSIAPISATKTEDLVADPLDDKELRSALGRDAKIVPYHDLSRYTNINQLLPKKKDAAMLLYENRPMDGHWVCLTKNNGEISFFDPYGEVIDKQLQYSKHSAQRVQGEGDTSLQNLLSTSKLPVFFNDYKYQRDGGGVNTCGRHCINFIRYNQKDGLDLEDYNEMMEKTQKKTGLPYDELIAKMVPVHIPHPDDDVIVGSARTAEEKKAYAREYYRRNREEISRKARAKRYGRPYEPPILYDSPFADEETMMEDKVGQSVLKMLNKKRDDEAKARVDADRAKATEMMNSIRRQKAEEAEAERKREEANRKQREYQQANRDKLNAQQRERYAAERSTVKRIVPKVPPKPNRPSQAKPKAPPRDWAKEIADRLAGLAGEGMRGGSAYEPYWWLK